MKKYGILINAANGHQTYLNIEKIVNTLNGKLVESKIINNNMYKIVIEINSAAFRLITKLTLRSRNIQQVYIIQIP